MVMTIVSKAVYSDVLAYLVIIVAAKVFKVAAS